MEALATSHFRHSPLDDPFNEIRLLQFDPVDSDQANVSLRISSWKLGGAPAYTAISYRWGDQHQDEIWIDGKSFVVRKNCTEALRQVRHHFAKDYIWIDSICIDQQNLDEKSKQVGRMWYIFRTAAKVCSCVGQHSNDSDLLFRVISAGRETGARTLDDWLALLPPGFDGWQLNDIMSKFGFRPYWERLWIVPKVSCGVRKYQNSFPVLCGYDRVDGQSLVMLSDSLRNVDHRSRPPFELVWSYYHTPLSILTDHLTEIRTLIAALTNFRQFKCAIPLDRVYALLPFVGEGARYKIQPNYNLSTLELVLELMPYLEPLQRHEVLDVFGIEYDYDTNNRTSIEAIMLEEYGVTQPLCTPLLIQIPASNTGGYATKGHVLKASDTMLTYCGGAQRVKLCTDSSQFVVILELLECAWGVSKEDPRNHQPTQHGRARPYTIMMGSREHEDLLVGMPTHTLGDPSPSLALSLRWLCSSRFELTAIGVMFGEQLPDIPVDDVPDMEIFVEQSKEQENLVHNTAKILSAGVDFGEFLDHERI